MKRWVFTFRVEPPVNETVSVKFLSGELSGSVCFAAYSPWLGWQLVLPGGRTEAIPEPQMIFLTDDYVLSHPRDLANTHKVLTRPRKKIGQLQLFD